MGRRRRQITTMDKVAIPHHVSFSGRTGIRLPLVSIIMLFILSTGCKKKDSIIPAIDAQAFSDYWMQGKAEISTYTVGQWLEGNMHTGQVTLLYMTEDFSKSKHTLLVKPSAHNEDVVRVMKMNLSKSFITGVSDHQVMTTVYAPVDYQLHSRAFKLSASCQDWSGQSYLQANYKGNRYEVMHYANSMEGDQSYSWMSSTLEDELWARIRIAPQTLPVGEIKIVPSAQSILLSKVDHKVFDATASLKDAGSTYSYEIEYKDAGRKMEIHFEKNFPHKILSWSESNGKEVLSSGKLNNTQLNDYWNYNQPKDSTMRKEIFLK